MIEPGGDNLSRRSTQRTVQIETSQSTKLCDISLEELSEIHDPKSIKFFQDRFENSAQGFYDTLKTDPVNGLDPELPDLESRTAQFGVNKLPEKKPKTFLQLVWHEMHDKVLILLSVAAVISLALGLYEYFGQPAQRDPEGNEIPKVEWVDGVAIIVAVLIVVSVGAANNYQKELQFAKLNAKKSDREIVVIRGGDEHVISIYELLVGDILTLQTGDVLPADCVLVSGSCECDESALTGESHSVHKIDIESALKKYNSDFPRSDVDIGTKGVPDSFLISGSRLLSGLGRAIVTAVGPNSIHGRTLESLKVENEDTPLQVRLNGLADGITKYGILASVILFIILFGKFLANLRPGKSYHDLKPAEKGSKFLDIVITAITLIVVAVPEGLPLAVTLALAFATTRMAKDQNLVRVLKACEIMGGATAVCSDKTGTLTENIMRVVNGNISGLEFDDNTTSTTTTSNELPLTDDIKLNILTNIALNSTAFENKQTVVNENPIVHKRRWFSRDSKIANFGNPDPEPFIGSKTETALLMLAEKSLEMTGSHSLHKLRTNISLLGVESIVQIIPFESSRKWGGIVLKYPNSNKYTFFIKGAAELVSSRCSHMVTSDSSVIPIEAEASEWVSQKINSYGEMALRAITFAHRNFELPSWPPHEYIGKTPDSADPELLIGDVYGKSSDGDIEGLILDGIVGIKDPLRPGVKEAVAQCKRAGVTVRMVTGDNIVTARAIALNCGILQEENLQNSICCMEGPAFRKLTKSQKLQILPELRVLARSSPEDKRVLVELLKKQGEVVAVTGDGTNDAPALKLADVGFSMGIAGTEVAREASDIILMTDDFAAIVNAIKWGRCVSSSIKKFIQFQLTVNITAVTLTFVSAVAASDGHSVLTAVQLLWVNLIMDTLAALALATDKPDDTVLDRKPDGRKAPLISVSMWKMILGQSSLQLVITFVLHFAGAQIFFGSGDITNHEQTQLDALTFNTFVWLQFFKLWVTRKLDEADGIKTIKGRCTAFNLNFFQHLLRNYYFLAIALLIGGCQVLIMFIGGTAFSVTRQTGAQWATAIICGMLSLPWGVVIRIIPDEWAVAIFPERLFKVTMDILSLRFLRSRKKHIILNSDDESEPIWLEVPQFKRTREDIIYVREFDSDLSFNPISLYHRWRGDSFSHDEESTIGENTHALSALTMVPTVVGGAIAGWSPLTQSTNGDKKIN